MIFNKYDPPPMLKKKNHKNLTETFKIILNTYTVHNYNKKIENPKNPKNTFSVQ